MSSVGLNHSIKHLRDENLELHDYNYSTVYLNAVKLGMSEVTFNGVSVGQTMADI